jgi:hypothetical protein
MTKEIDVSHLDTDRLRTLIVNHQKKGKTDAQLYLDAMQELERQTGGGLDFDKSYRVIREAAGEKRFLSYKELADASGAEWSKVHYAIGGHLWRLVEYAHCKGWPMLSAIVANQQNVATGKMELKTLKGFIRAARGPGLRHYRRRGIPKETADFGFSVGGIGSGRSGKEGVGKSIAGDESMNSGLTR